jgi:ATP-dependent DNA helicase PIF1
MSLNTEQEAAMGEILAGKSIFLTGPGGTGKSFLIRTVKELLTKAGKQVAVTAMTGCAALQLECSAKTLHSWATIGLGKDSVESMIINMRKPYNRRAISRWKFTDVLIIDEISMMTGDLLEKLDSVGRIIRNRAGQPMGGIQVIFVGDFCQLPPVVNGSSRGDLSGSSVAETNTPWLFDTEVWKEIVAKTICLKQIQRQQEPLFQRVLNEARIGALSDESITILEGRKISNIDMESQQIKPTLIFSRNAKVDEINDKNMDALDTELIVSRSRIAYSPKLDSVAPNPDELDVKKALNRLESDASFLPVLSMKEGAQVMLISNLDIDNGLVNGSRGVITGFMNNIPIVLFRNGVQRPIDLETWYTEDFPAIGMAQIPLRIAYAITIHKCISGDTLLSMPSKGLVPISEIAHNQLEGSVNQSSEYVVQGLSENKSVIEIYKGFKEDGFRLTSSFGYEITTSNRHPLLVMDAQENKFVWKKTPEIQKGDYVVLKKGSESEGKYYSLESIKISLNTIKEISVPSKLDEDVSYLLGCILGNGCINEKTYRFDMTNADYDILLNCQNILSQSFDIKTEIHKLVDRKIPTWKIFFHSKGFIEILRSIGYNFGKANTKIIPQCVLQSPITVQKAIIQGLYDTDGSVSNSVINFTSTSDIMARQIQQILLNIGVVASRNKLAVVNALKNTTTSYRINISGYAVSMFIEHIGFGCDRKWNSLEERFNKQKSLRQILQSQAFEIPAGNILLSKLRDEMRGSLKRIPSAKISPEGNKIISSVVNNRQKLRCEMLEILCDSVREIEQYPTGFFLSYLHKNGVIIDTVRSIETVKDIQMYDIGVNPDNSSGMLPDGHDFIAGGFVNHNCQGATLDCALVDIGKSTFEYGQAYVALSRVRSLEGLFIYELQASRVKAHPRVIEYYNDLESQA